MIEIKDNILKEEDADYIESVFKNNHFPYYLNPIVFDSNKKDYQMTHIFFDDNKITSDFFNILKPILNYLKPKALVRIKTNLIHKSNEIEIHGYHTDYN
jgi:shikimate 5-dehydrogenase